MKLIMQVKYLQKNLLNVVGALSAKVEALFIDIAQLINLITLKFTEVA